MMIAAYVVLIYRCLVEALSNFVQWAVLTYSSHFE